MSATSVLLADAQFLFAQALGKVLAAEHGLKVLSDHPNRGGETVRLAERHRPDVILVDYWLPDMDGLTVIQQLRARVPRSKVFVLSWYHGPPDVKGSLDAGAVGFLPKGVSTDRVAEGIARARNGENPVFLQELIGMVDNIVARNQVVEDLEERFATLTTRELEVLQALSQGHTAHDVAKLLFVSYATVRTHINRILTKTNTASQLEVVVLARERGIVR